MGNLCDFKKGRTAMMNFILLLVCAVWWLVATLGPAVFIFGIVCMLCNACKSK